MKKVEIREVDNGYIVKCDDQDEIEGGILTEEVFLCWVDAIETVNRFLCGIELIKKKGKEE